MTEAEALRIIESWEGPAHSWSKETIEMFGFDEFPPFKGWKLWLAHQMVLGKKVILERVALFA